MTHGRSHPINTLVWFRTFSADGFPGDCIPSSASVCLHAWKVHGDRRGWVEAAGGSGRSDFGACCRHGAEPHCCSAQVPRSRGGTFPTAVRGPCSCIASSVLFPTGLIHPSPTLHRGTATDSHSPGEPRPAFSIPCFPYCPPAVLWCPILLQLDVSAYPTASLHLSGTAPSRRHCCI